MSNQITTKKTMSQVLALDSIKQLGANLALTPAQITNARSSALALSSNSNLADCDAFSLAKFCFETARYNFATPDCCYPVPYKSKDGVKRVQAQVGYKGYRELCMRTGKYSKVDVVEVKACDKVIRNRETGELIVEFNPNYLEAEKSETIGFFAYAKDKKMRLVNSLFLSKEDAKKHGKRYSKSFGGLWTTDFDVMAKKTALKMLCNKLDKSTELQSALELDQVVLGRENEKNTYEDNPLNNEVIDVSDKKSNVTNNILANKQEEKKVEVEEVEVEPFVHETGEEVKEEKEEWDPAEAFATDDDMPY